MCRHFIALFYTNFLQFVVKYLVYLINMQLASTVLHLLRHAGLTLLTHPNYFHLTNLYDQITATEQKLSQLLIFNKS